MTSKKKVKKKAAGAAPAPKLIKLDIACGQNKREGYVGIDIADCKGVDIIHDLFKFPWPVESNSVEEAFSSHFFEHVPGLLRGQFMDELYRVLAPKASCALICPYWSSPRAVQDFTHTWPPIVEQSFLYFNKQWRIDNKLDHYPVSCDFDFTYGYAITDQMANKAREAQEFGIRHYINSVNDIHVTLTKR